MLPRRDSDDFCTCPLLGVYVQGRMDTGGMGGGSKAHGRLVSLSVRRMNSLSFCPVVWLLSFSFQASFSAADSEETAASAAAAKLPITPHLRVLAMMGVVTVAVAAVTMYVVYGFLTYWSLLFLPVLGEQHMPSVYSIIIAEYSVLLWIYCCCDCCCSHCKRWERQDKNTPNDFRTVLKVEQVSHHHHQSPSSPAPQL